MGENSAKTLNSLSVRISSSFLMGWVPRIWARSLTDERMEAGFNFVTINLTLCLYFTCMLFDLNGIEIGSEKNNVYNMNSSWRPNQKRGLSKKITTVLVINIWNQRDTGEFKWNVALKSNNHWKKKHRNNELSRRYISVNYSFPILNEIWISIVLYIAVFNSSWDQSRKSACHRHCILIVNLWGNVPWKWR